MIHTFQCIDAHTCGNPVRLVVQGGPELNGPGMRERRMHFMNEFDWVRRGLMFEPRGHDMMSGSILYEPENKENDIAILFIETSGCLPMCGHGTIGTVTIAMERKLITPKIPGQLKIETPAGEIITYFSLAGDKVSSVKILNVPSFLDQEGLEIECPPLGKIILDVAYGGNFYAIVDIQQNFKGIEHYSARSAN